MELDQSKIVVLGLGYVGLPLAVEFGKKYSTVGFDINKSRVLELDSGIDTTLEVTKDQLKSSEKLRFTAKETELSDGNVFIVTVPTPIDAHRQPDLTPLIEVSKLLGRIIKKGDIVIYESTVYPGATEEECIPVIERVSGLAFNKDFYAGYSPERINPGDKTRPLTKIMKVTSGSTTEIADFVDNLYKSIIAAGTYKASSIKVAEASKIIENTQRDVNIALINELSMIFSQMNIDTYDVLEAASTKWNFIKLQPGLVGGHCIGVDPYYLVHKSMSVGHIPDIIRTAREINDGMARFIVGKLIKEMIFREQPIKGAKVLVMGITFKENCPDIRNTKVVDLINELQTYGMSVDVYDSWANSSEVEHEFGLQMINKPRSNDYDSIIVAVAHDGIEEGLVAFGKDNCTIFDMKNALDPSIKNVIRM